MKIGIIGAGNMGSALARRIAAAGHDVMITARDLGKAESVAKETGPRVKAVPGNQVAQGADLLIAATPAKEQAAAICEAGDMKDRIIVDIANPLTPDFSDLTVGFTTSFAEELAKQIPGARFVKAFNTLFARIIAEGPDFGNGLRAAVLYAGDDEKAMNTVHALIESMGFEAIDAGPLRNARYLEPLGMLNIWLGHFGQKGTDIAPTWISRRTAAVKRAA